MIVDQGRTRRGVFVGHSALGPTIEQQAAVDAFGRGSHMAIQAGAGTGKTTTLRLLSGGTSRSGLYIAYNRAIAEEARRRFPRHVRCRTAHSMAYHAVGHRYRARLDAPRISSTKAGAALGIHRATMIGGRKVTPAAQSFATVRTVQRFCYSDDLGIESRHVPRLRGLDSADSHQKLIDVVLPFARKAWTDLQDENSGRVRFDHDHYLKMWALTHPALDYEFILLDEAQDTNPVVEQVFNAQRADSQLVLVGDSAQAIYGWRGAQDVMFGFDGSHLGLTQSFRFGAAVAEEANRWLTIVDAPIRLTGDERVTSEIRTIVKADAVLCRTNVGAMLEVMSQLADGRKVALVGGGRSLAQLAEAARDLMAGRRSNHPELCLFASWGELQDYAENDPAGADLAPLVALIDDHGVDVVLDAVGRLSSESVAEVTVSTAHKAKGREWDTVRIADDFTEPENPDGTRPAPIGEADARLAYVAVTRARHGLDLGGLAWVRQHPDGRPGTVRPNVPELLPGEDRSLGSGLFVDLVPDSCWFTNVRSCVDTKDWERLRRMVNNRAGHRCEICGRGKDSATRRWLEAHERWAYDDTTGVQSLRRIILLCTDCHQTTHFGFAQINGRESHALAHLMKVTGMTADEAQQHIADAFRTWNRRSARVWRLDLSILTGAGVTIAPPPAAAERAVVAGQHLQNLPRRSGF
ncbi:UvrD-helicase domain-containing protein [Nocardia sp.]|uniref:UvrD-helicase domain-containing protein n=1 Tax=Nocardia sp. TaxID=1821 RepID=UPI0026108C93|nr:UvrD-helicase domain-containing protein [Nocardia sp.]